MADQQQQQPPGGRATRGPAPPAGEHDPQTPWKGEDDHGWAPDAPGTGEAKERTIEGHQKAHDAEHGTQEGSRAEGGYDADTSQAPVPDSETRRGEDVVGQEGKEPDRQDAGTQGPAERPVGTSDMSDSTSVQTGKSKPLDEEDMPTMPSGDQGG